MICQTLFSRHSRRKREQTWSSSVLYQIESPSYHPEGAVSQTHHICAPPTYGCRLPRNCLCHEKQAQLRSLWSTCRLSVLLTHTRLNRPTRRPQRRLLIPGPSLRVWACEDESCWDDLFWGSNVVWLIYLGFPTLREGLRWELFNAPAQIWRQVSVKFMCELQSGSCGGFGRMRVNAEISISQWIWLPCGRLARKIITVGFSSCDVLCLQHRGRQSTGDGASCWAAGRSGRSTSATTPTRDTSSPPSRCRLIRTVRKPARWERTAHIWKKWHSACILGHKTGFR